MGGFGVFVVEESGWRIQVLPLLLLSVGKLKFLVVVVVVGVSACSDFSVCSNSVWCVTVSFLREISSRLNSGLLECNLVWLI